MHIIKIKTLNPIHWYRYMGHRFGQLINGQVNGNNGFTVLWQRVSLNHRHSYFILCTVGFYLICASFIYEYLCGPLKSECVNEHTRATFLCNALENLVPKIEFTKQTNERVSSTCLYVNLLKANVWFNETSQLMVFITVFTKKIMSKWEKFCFWRIRLAKGSEWGSVEMFNVKLCGNIERFNWTELQ